MENNALDVWRTKKKRQTLGVIEGGRESLYALASWNRKLSGNGPDQTVLRKKYDGCLVPGALYDFSAWVQLVNQKSGEGVNCTATGSLEAIDRKMGNGLCPTLFVKAWDLEGRTREWRARRYLDAWRLNDWNNLHARFTMWPQTDDWSGDVDRLRIRISEMNR